MRALLLLLLAAGPAGRAHREAPADAPREAPKAAAAPALVPEEPALANPAGADTKCAACHVTSSWTQVQFNHDRTGFPLKGAHASTGCKECHPVDFNKPVARSCLGCHTDVHAGDLGTHCDGCHDESSWRSRIDVDAHRRTAFPLLGGHATIPCGECHVSQGSRRFTRQVVECGACHQKDYDRTRSTPVNHAALGFDPLACRSCHGALSFKQARYPDHDRCVSNDLSINVGLHTGIACAQCHDMLPTAMQSGACTSGTYKCVSCHEHQCAGPGGNTKTDLIHIQKNVMGYRCSDNGCYECHQLLTVTP